MNRQRLRVPIQLLLCLLVAVYGCLAQKSPETASISPKASGQTLGPLPLTSAPEFTLSSVSGESVHLSDFRNRVVFLNFWATWCAPCKILMPWLADLQSEFGPRGFQVLAIALDDDATNVEIGEYGDSVRANYPILVGNDKVADRYGGIPAMPASFLISRDGRIVDRITGIKSKSELEKSVKKALDEETASPKPEGVAKDTQAQK